MRRISLRWLPALVPVVLTVLGAVPLLYAVVPPSVPLTPRQSSPIALTSDDRLLVNVNPDADTVTVFDVSTDTPVKLHEIKVGRDPTSVAIHPDNIRAYVANA